MNKGSPSLLWNLYDNDGDHANSYFGAREANAAILDLLRAGNKLVRARARFGPACGGRRPVSAGAHEAWCRFLRLSLWPRLA
jgi:hypothetical protein